MRILALSTVVLCVSFSAQAARSISESEIAAPSGKTRLRASKGTRREKLRRAKVESQTRVEAYHEQPIVGHPVIDAGMFKAPQTVAMPRDMGTFNVRTK
jgi:hypothetical protein